MDRYSELYDDFRHTILYIRDKYSVSLSHRELREALLHLAEAHGLNLNEKEMETFIIRGFNINETDTVDR